MKKKKKKKANREKVFNKWESFFFDTFVPKFMWALFCCGVGTTFSGIAIGKLVEKYHGSYSGPIISGKILQLFSTPDHEMQKTLIEFTVTLGLIGLEILFIASLYYFGRWSVKKDSNRIYIYFKIIGGLLVAVYLIWVLRDPKITSQKDGAFKLITSVSLTGAYVFGTMVSALKKLYSWLKKPTDEISLKKLTFIWTIIAAIIGWNLVK